MYEPKSIEKIVKDTFDNFLPEFWKRDETSGNYQIIKSLSSETVSIAQKLNHTYLQIMINTATGDYLNDIGKLFKLARKTGESDEDYRQRIKAYYQIFLAGGSNKGIRDALALLTDLTPDAITIEDGVRPLIFSIDISTDNVDVISKLDDIFNIINQAKAAGTYLEKITFSSLGLVFRVNLSEVNGEDLL